MAPVILRLLCLIPYTYQGDIHKYYEFNSNLQIINNITITGSNVYYLVNYSLEPGIYSKSNGWNLLDVGFNKPINYYFLKENDKFLIGSMKGLYYHD